MSNGDVAVVIACYNEELTIKNVINAFRNVLSGANYQYKIYVYDNNSNDNTYAIVESMVSENIILRKEPFQGKGNVIRRAFHDIDAKCYVLVDGDDTYSADDVIKLITPIIDNNYDMVSGDRLSVNYFEENKRPFHSFGNRLVSKLINSLFYSNIIDIMTGYRAFSRKFVKTAGILAQGFEVETEMTILALDGHYKIKEVPICYKDRIEGSVSKLNTFSDGFRVLKTIFTLFKDYRPFEFFFILFCFFALISLILFVPVFIEYLNTGLVPRFPTLFVSIFFALLGILSFCIGTILSTLIKIQKRQKEVVILNYKD